MTRKDGRKNDELRPLEITIGVVPNANGSALVKMGKTTAIAAVYGPRLLHPRHLQQNNTAILQTYYSMLPFSTTERVRPGPSRRNIEICKVTRNALEPVVCLEEFPKTTIDVFIDMIQSNAGTRTAGINAASVALADAGIPMKGLVGSAAAGMIGKDYVLDLEGKEEEVTACDMPIAYTSRTGKITLLQLDGDISPDNIKKVMELAVEGCKKAIEVQKEALRKRWMK